MTMTESKLFRIWLGWSTDNDGNRDEVLRLLATSRDQAIDYAKKKMMKPEYIDDVEEWGDDQSGGWGWDEKEDECGCGLDQEDCTCYTHYYTDIQEIEEYTEDDLSLKLLTPTLGTTDKFFDITKESEQTVQPV